MEHFAVTAKFGDSSLPKHAGVLAPCFLFECVMPVLPNQADGVIALPNKARLIRFADGVIVSVELPHLPADGGDKEDDEHAPKLFPKAALAFRGVLVFHARFLPHAANDDKARGMHPFYSAELE